MADGLRPMSKLVPSAALFGWDMRSWQFIEADIAVVGMSFHDAVFRPSDQGAFGDSKFCAGFCFCQHSPLAQPVVARAQTILLDEIDDAQVAEPGFSLAAPR